MNQLIEFFSEDKDLNALQMSCRGIIVFLVALLLIRISGRRSFGVRTPLDNIIVILLGAILSRAVVGVSPFWAVICTSFVIVLLHRLFGRLLLNSKNFAKLVEGEKIILFRNGQFLEENLKRAILCKEDIMQGVRKSGSTENLQEIDKIYIERNGEITMLKKNKES
ncbi:MAG: hypothetical protein JWP81_1994 [Ferruginibacter sp.]|nr:hypothetical protein [Ferruginibacter sp.]